MNIALCTLDNTTYTAVDFNQTENFIAKRRSLVCTQCNSAAFYRGPTRNGREACFGASHAEGCTLAALEYVGTPPGQGDVEDEVFTAGQRIVVDFNQGTPATDTEAQPVGRPTEADNGRVYNGEGTTVRETMSRRMSSLLRNLIVNEEFRRSTQIMEIVGLGEYPVADFFVNFGDISEGHIDCYHGYWGMVTDARIVDNGTLWFNSGGREDLSVLLDQRYIEGTFQRFRIEDEEDIAGAYILVFGEFKRAAGGNRKKFVHITDPFRFTLRLAR